MRNAFFDESSTRKLLADFVLNAPKFSMGDQCKSFEEEFAEYQGRKYAVLVNSGGSANLAILQALINNGKLKKGDIVGFSALTWSTNVMPIIQLGLIPYPVDCDQSTLNICIDELKDFLTKVKIKALFITNALGLCGELDQIKSICNNDNILLLEDNCESLGSEYAGLKLGNFSEAASFSFFIAHHMSTIEGGMICTDDESLWQMLVMVRANGWDRNLPQLKQAQLRRLHDVESAFNSKYTFFDLAFNIRPTEITGFLGRVQLPLLADKIIKRELNFKRVQHVVEKNSDFIPLAYHHMDVVSAFAMPFVLRTKELRDYYLNRFATYGIEVRPMIAGNIQRQPFYSKYVSSSYSLHGANHLHDCSFYCSNYPELANSEIEAFESCVIQ